MIPVSYCSILWVQVCHALKHIPVLTLHSMVTWQSLQVFFIAAKTAQRRRVSCCCLRYFAIIWSLISDGLIRWIDQVCKAQLPSTYHIPTCVSSPTMRNRKGHLNSSPTRYQTWASICHYDEIDESLPSTKPSPVSVRWPCVDGMHLESATPLRFPVGWMTEKCVE